MAHRVFVGNLDFNATENEVRDFFFHYSPIEHVEMKRGYCFLDFVNFKDADDAVWDLNDYEMLGRFIKVEHAKGERGGPPPRRGGYADGGYGGYDDRRRSGGRDFAPRRGGPPRGPPRRDGGYVGYGDEPIRGGGFHDDGPPRRRDGPPRGRGRGRGGRGGRFGPKRDFELRIANLSSRVSWQDLKDHFRDLKCEVTFADAHQKEKNTGIVCFQSKKELDEAMEKANGTDLDGKNNQRKIECSIFVRGRKGISRSKTRSLSPERTGSDAEDDTKDDDDEQEEVDNKSRSRSLSPLNKTDVEEESKE